MVKYDTEKRNYVYGSSDRFDKFTDRIRSVRNKKYLYLRNSFPKLPKYKDVANRKNIPMMPKFLKLRDEGKLNDVQKIWFGTKKLEELYDCEVDPHNINNLAEDPKYASILLKMRRVLDTHMKGRIDYGKIPEAELINQMWTNFEQPITASVDVEIKSGLATLSSKTKGASIAYIISNKLLEELDFNSPWQLYSRPIKLKKNDVIYTIAERIGYKESEISLLLYQQ